MHRVIVSGGYWIPLSQRLSYLIHGEIMFLHSKKADALVKVLDNTELIDPSTNTIQGRLQAGEEEQDPEQFAKTDLLFPSGETLPRCWMDADYRSQTN